MTRRSIVITVLSAAVPRRSPSQMLADPIWLAVIPVPDLIQRVPIPPRPLRRNPDGRPHGTVRLEPPPFEDHHTALPATSGSEPRRKDSRSWGRTCRIGVPAPFQRRRQNLRRIQAMPRLHSGRSSETRAGCLDLILSTMSHDITAHLVPSPIFNRPLRDLAASLILDPGTRTHLPRR